MAACGTSDSCQLFLSRLRLSVQVCCWAETWRLNVRYYHFQSRGRVEVKQMPHDFTSIRALVIVHRVFLGFFCFKKAIQILPFLKNNFVLPCPLALKSQKVLSLFWYWWKRTEKEKQRGNLKHRRRCLDGGEEVHFSGLISAVKTPINMELKYQQ